ncbi:hypothetical protein [Lacticaseibacillus sharpeae]|uniref:Uncharacterized protein n=1 Tax=Lacticaseibacillus sharpeae JCM 1186 = DSM 20505 TaxID=1291052 RepID=A0A0R1ZRW1_9LACO|nr:hypothetical protein [Lacticaseibacillus sharpeae]KRM54422.1 hypothetical protein FC18_GL000226 [Lacticaseibacillus sharpeae JCM 1186 = DSM 20505]
MTNININDPHAVADFVQQQGITPDHNYIVVRRRMSAGRAMSFSLFHRYPDGTFDQQLARHEPEYLMIISPSQIYFHQLTPTMTFPSQVERANIQEFVWEEASNEHCFHFTTTARREDYYMFNTEPQSPLWSLDNYYYLQLNGFCGLTKPDPHPEPAKTDMLSDEQKGLISGYGLAAFANPQPLTDPRPYKPSAKIQAAASKRKADPAPYKPASKQDAASYRPEQNAKAQPTNRALDHADIPASGRPERKREGLLSSLLGKPHRS